MSLMLLALERQLGIGWDYHPDAVTYAKTFNNVISNIINSGRRDLLTQLYFVFSKLLNGDIAALIGVNIIVYSATNCMIYGQLKGFITSKAGLICVLLIIFMPYRMHLAVHVLKDTLLIAFLVGSILGIRFLILPAILISARSVFYLPSVMRYRGAILCLVGFLASIIVFDEFRIWV